MIRQLRVLVATLALCSAACAQQPRNFNPVVDIQTIADLDGQGETVLRGIGLVVGLAGTGDSGSELIVARPLAEAYKNNGLPIASLEELAAARSAALVWITCKIPSSGARMNDKFDVHVSAMHSASSLKGGRLFLSPLTGPLRGQGVFAMAEGAVELEQSSHLTVARVPLGAQIIEEITMAPIGDSIRLVVKPPFRAWSTTTQLAIQINDINAAIDFDNPDEHPPIAKAIDETTVTIVIPIEERSDPARFIAEVMSLRFSPSLLDLPAKVVVNRRTGNIIVTGNVEILPVAISHRNLVVTTTDPPPVASAADPILRQDNWVALSTTGQPSELARIQDLLDAFKTLDVPIDDQISIIRQMYVQGSLIGTLVID